MAIRPDSTSHVTVDVRNNAPTVSLRGAGEIQRRVWRAFVANPGAELTTADLARWCYPRWEGAPLRNQRLAIRRAAAKMATRVRRRSIGIVFRACGEPRDK